MKRIITTNDEQGRSRILVEEDIGANALVWEARPGQPLGGEPRARARELDIEDGLHARYVEIPPDAVLDEFLRQGIPGHDENGFHRTGTLDFLVLLDGKLTLKLDDGEAELSPGDVVVQRSTNHAWRAGEKPARCFVVMCKLPEGA